MQQRPIYETQTSMPAHTCCNGITHFAEHRTGLRTMSRRCASFSSVCSSSCELGSCMRAHSTSDTLEALAACALGCVEPPAAGSSSERATPAPAPCRLASPAMKCCASCPAGKAQRDQHLNTGPPRVAHLARSQRQRCWSDCGRSSNLARSCMAAHCGPAAYECSTKQHCTATGQVANCLDALQCTQSHAHNSAHSMIPITSPALLCAPGAMDRARCRACSCVRSCFGLVMSASTSAAASPMQIPISRHSLGLLDPDAVPFAARRGMARWACVACTAAARSAINPHWPLHSHPGWSASAGGNMVNLSINRKRNVSLPNTLQIGAAGTRAWTCCRCRVCMRNASRSK